MGPDLAGFLLLAVALTVTPGPDDVLVLRFGAGGGRRCAAAAALGVTTGTLAWGAATGVGLAAVMSGAGPVPVVVRLCGAAYLAGLGIAGLRAQQPAGRHRDGGPRVDAVARGVRTAFAAGVLSDLLNPKIGLFYVAVLPQFVPAGGSALGWSLVLCLIDAAVALAWLLLMVWIAGAALARLRRPRVDVWLQRGLSAALIGIGAAVSLGL